MELSLSDRPVDRWLFGKLPMLGDFLSRGLDFDFRDALDHWLSAEMEAGRAAFGDDFEPRYVTAPAWCFVDCDMQGRWSGGALCASMDRVGRKFPVVLAHSAQDIDEAVLLSGGCLEALYGALQQGWSVDQLHGEAIMPTPIPWQPSGPSWALLAEDTVAVEKKGRFPMGIINAMLELAA